MVKTSTLPPSAPFASTIEFPSGEKRDRPIHVP
jgi:hypothetical protein